MREEWGVGGHTLLAYNWRDLPRQKVAYEVPRFLGIAHAVDTGTRNPLSSKGHMAKNPSLERIFLPHQLFGDQNLRRTAIREAALTFAQVVRESSPPSREQSLAFTDIQRASQMACDAISVNEVEVVSPAIDSAVEPVQSTDAAASINQEQN